MGSLLISKWNPRPNEDKTKGLWSQGIFSRLPKRVILTRAFWESHFDPNKSQNNAFFVFLDSSRVWMNTPILPVKLFFRGSLNGFIWLLLGSKYYSFVASKRLHRKKSRHDFSEGVILGLKKDSFGGVKWAPFYSAQLQIKVLHFFNCIPSRGVEFKITLSSFDGWLNKPGFSEPSFSSKWWLFRSIRLSLKNKLQNKK